MVFANLTPHPIVVLDADCTAYTFAPQGEVARVSVRFDQPEDLGTFSVRKKVTGEVEGLPAPQPDTVFIVSGMVLDALKGTRPDVVAPDTGPSATRNSQGHIVSVAGFVQ